MIPQAYYEKVGAAGFEKAPIGCGPYMIEEFVARLVRQAQGLRQVLGGQAGVQERDDQLRHRPERARRPDRDRQVRHHARPALRGVRPAEEAPALSGVSSPITDIAMLFITNVAPMLDDNVRQACVHAVDKQAIVKNLLRGYGIVIDTLQTPQYPAYDPSIKVKYDPALAKAAARQVGLQRRQAGEVHDPDHARLHAEGLRDGAGDRRHVAQGGHRGRDRGLRDRQALRAAPEPQAGADGLLQLGRRDRRPERIRPASRCSGRVRTRAGSRRSSTP